MKKKLLAISIFILMTILCACASSGNSKITDEKYSDNLSVEQKISESNEGFISDLDESEKEVLYEAPTVEDLRAAGINDKFQLPEEENYLSSREKMFVITPSSTVFSNTKSGKSVPIGNLVHGDEVTVIAKQNSVACVLCSIDGKISAGWISQNSLGYNNTKNVQKNVFAIEHSGIPGIKSIQNCGQEKSITLPEADSYISSFDKMYVSQTAVNALSFIEKNASIPECQLLVGDEVNVIAVKDSLACILFQTDCGEKAGWVYREQLSYNDPREENKPVTAIDHKGVPNKTMLEHIGVDKTITLPNDKNYTAIFDRMYITPNIVQVFSVNTDKMSIVECTLVSGSEVNVAAIQEKLALILFQTDCGEKAGWVALDALCYNNPNNKPQVVQAIPHTGKPGINTIKELGLERSLMLPDEESYISSYDRMYNTVSSLQVFSHTDNKRRNISFTIQRESEVNVIAIQNSFALILAQTDEGEKAGWVALDALCYNNPNNKPQVVQAIPHTGKPGINTVKELGLDRSLTLPDEESYISSYDRMYNAVPSLQVFSFIDAKHKNVSFTLQMSSEVNVIAIQEKFAFILAQTDEGEKSGWINLDALRYNNPTKETKPSKVNSLSGIPSISTIEKLGLIKSVTLPDNNEYLPAFNNMFVQNANSSVFSFYEKGNSNLCCSLSSGSEVSVMAISRQSAFILFETDEGRKCGWTLLQNLSYNNPLNKPKPTTVNEIQGTPGIKDIEKLGLEKSMTLPESDSYLENYAVMNIAADCSAYSFNSKESTVQACVIAKDSTVIQIAKQNGYACVLCQTDNGEKALWVIQTALKEIK